MARFPNSWKFASSLAAAALLACPADAVEIPAGAQLHIRLKSKVSTTASKPKDAVEAILAAPVMSGTDFALPAGAILRGSIEEAAPATKPDERASLELRFTEVEAGGAKHKIATRVKRVDNARESVDAEGKILGILASESISSRIDQGISRVAERYAGLADILGAAKGTMLKASEGDISYEPGVELDIELTAPLVLDKPAGPGPAGGVEALSDGELVSLAVAQPFQTFAEKPPKPSDVTNLMLIGTRERIEAAGWAQAHSLSAQSKFETFRAIAENRGYKEAPVSILLLDDRPPDLVFQKQNNTFAQRHHLRVWQRPASWRDLPVWVIAATHDTGIEFSQENRTFIHKIDPQIDRERSKVANDLILTGMVKGTAAVERPNVPKKSKNATGDDLETDGKIVVLYLP